MLTIENGIFEVKATGGDTRLGGTLSYHISFQHDIHMYTDINNEVLQ
jgi:hypothetical protein